VEANLCRVFSVCIYVQCIAVGDPVIKMGELGSGLLARKVESVGYMDSTIAGSMNVRS
jgi:hypothetical protein